MEVALNLGKKRQTTWDDLLKRVQLLEAILYRGLDPRVLEGLQLWMKRTVEGCSGSGPLASESFKAQAPLPAIVLSKEIGRNFVSEGSPILEVGNFPNGEVSLVAEEDDTYKAIIGEVGTEPGLPVDDMDWTGFFLEDNKNIHN